MTTDEMKPEPSEAEVHEALDAAAAQRDKARTPGIPAEELAKLKATHDKLCEWWLATETLREPMQQIMERAKRLVHVAGDDAALLMAAGDAVKSAAMQYRNFDGEAQRVKAQLEHLRSQLNGEPTQQIALFPLPIRIA